RQLVSAEGPERGVERRVEIARVDRQAGGDSRRKLLDEVEPADLDRVLADLTRKRIHRALDRVGRLRPACAAVRIGRRRVREDAGALEVVRGRVVATAVEPGAEE